MKPSSYHRRKKLISRTDAQKILEPHVPVLVEYLDHAWTWTQEILDQDPERRITFDTSLEAAMVNTRFVFKSRAHFEGHTGTNVQMFSRHMSVLFDGGLRLRFIDL